jgi:hypothetical protein
MTQPQKEEYYSSEKHKVKLAALKKTQCSAKPALQRALSLVQSSMDTRNQPVECGTNKKKQPTPPKKEEEEKKELRYQFQGLPPRRLSSGSLLLAQKQLKSS